MASPPPVHRDADGRPDFMVVLGVAPPYVEDDVKQAYFAKAKELHPDHGGNAHDFDTLHKAFQQAQQYLEFRRDSRGWIAKQMDGYLQSRQVIELLEQFGAKVETTMIDWLQRSFGDFAELTDSITGIRLDNSPRAEQLIDVMIANRGALERLTRLEMPGCQVSDASALRLAAFEQLQHLDLSGTQITKASLGTPRRANCVELVRGIQHECGLVARKKLASQLAKRREKISILIQ